PIHFGMVVIGKDTQVRSLEEDARAAAEAEIPVSEVIRSAVRKTPVPLEMPTPAGHGPLLTWSAANEYGVFGYEVYRAESASGPFRRMTENFILRLDESATVGSVYRWRDTSAKSNLTYYYYVGLVFEDGRRREFTAP